MNSGRTAVRHFAYIAFLISSLLRNAESWALSCSNEDEKCFEPGAEAYLECVQHRRKSNTASLRQSLEKDKQKIRAPVVCSCSTNAVPRNNSQQCVQLGDDVIKRQKK